jgi:ABC-type phosphate/phosphonate transport system ATPase subunit
LNKNFVQAVENCFTNLDEKNINKLFSRISSIQQQPSVSDYLIVFENILNKNKKNSHVLIKLTTLKIK